MLELCWKVWSELLLFLQPNVNCVANKEDLQTSTVKAEVEIKDCVSFTTFKLQETNIFEMSGEKKKASEPAGIWLSRQYFDSSALLVLNQQVFYEFFHLIQLKQSLKD